MPRVLRQLINIRLKRMTQVEVARRMNVSRQRVCNIERMRDGVPTLETVERYAKAVGARLQVLSS